MNKKNKIFSVYEVIVLIVLSLSIALMDFKHLAILDKIVLITFVSLIISSIFRFIAEHKGFPRK